MITSNGAAGPPVELRKSLRLAERALALFHISPASAQAMAFAVIVAVASAPATGLALAGGWLAVVTGLIAGEEGWFAAPSSGGRTPWGQPVFSWFLFPKHNMAEPMQPLILLFRARW